MGQLPEPEAVIIAIVDADPSVQRGLQRLVEKARTKPCLAESKQIDEGPLSAWEVRLPDKWHLADFPRLP